VIGLAVSCHDFYRQSSESARSPLFVVVKVRRISLKSKQKEHGQVRKKENFVWIFGPIFEKVLGLPKCSDVFFVFRSQRLAISQEEAQGRVPAPDLPNTMRGRRKSMRGNGVASFKKQANSNPPLTFGEPLAW
jgi:hypothetical protein